MECENGHNIFLCSHLVYLPIKDNSLIGALDLSGRLKFQPSSLLHFKWALTNYWAKNNHRIMRIVLMG